jgi:hypothetical protein
MNQQFLYSENDIFQSAQTLARFPGGGISVPLMYMKHIPMRPS